MLCRKRTEVAFSEEVALGWIWEACEIPALSLLHLCVYLPVPGPRYAFLFHARPVMFFEPAWAVEMGAAEPPTRKLSKSPSVLGESLSRYCLTALARVRSPGTRVSPAPPGLLVLGGVVGDGGALPSRTPTPRS